MTYNVAPNFNSEREEFLYESCLKDSDLLATVITEYITRLSVTDLSEDELSNINDYSGYNFLHIANLIEAQL
jgi:hypothetical protein